MKIAFCIRPDYITLHGGDVVQMIKTKENLEILYDYNIDIIINEENINESYKFIHIFNYANTSITERFINKAKSLNIPIVASSIFWDYSYAFTPIIQRFIWNVDFVSERYINTNIKFYKLLSSIISRPLLISKYFKSKLKYFIESSDLILPNSKEEGDLLLRFAECESASIKNKVQVVFNGVDIKSVNILAEDVFFEKYKIPRNYILQVGRIQFIKNQLNLLSSLMDKPELPIVFLGKIVEQNYFDNLKKLANKRGNVFFITEVDHSEVYSFFYYAKVHALLSFRESPGLVSLEALSQGCPIVIPDKRFLPVNTYFENVPVEIVDIFNKESILQGIENAYNKEKVTVDLADFSWENVAKQTHAAYKSLL